MCSQLLKQMIRIPKFMQTGLYVMCCVSVLQYVGNFTVMIIPVPTQDIHVCEDFYVGVYDGLKLKSFRKRFPDNI